MNDDDESEYEIGIVFIEEMKIGIGMVLFETTLIIKHWSIIYEYDINRHVDSIKLGGSCIHN